MRTNIVLFFMVTVVFTGLNYSGKAEPEKKKNVLTGTIPGLKINNIITSQLELVKGTEVIVNHVEIPPNTTLPKHWHPGEEFIYVLEGSAVMWVKGKTDMPIKKGDVFKVPFKKVHTGTSGKEGGTFLVFLVHEQGKPVRVLVE